MRLFGNQTEEASEIEEQDEEQEDEETVYEYKIECDNCLEEEWADIPLGVTVIEYKKIHKCSNCGCLLFQENKIEQGEEE